MGHKLDERRGWLLVPGPDEDDPQVLRGSEWAARRAGADPPRARYPRLWVRLPVHRSRRTPLAGHLHLPQGLGPGPQRQELQSLVYIPTISR